VSPWILLTGVVILAVWVVRRRLTKQTSTPMTLPTLPECFSFATVPVVFGSSMLLLFKIAAPLLAGNFIRSSGAHPESFSEQAVRSRPSIIMIVADGLRAESMSVYGHQDQTTPFLEKLAQTSSVYLDAHSNSTTTQASITTLLSGKHPLLHGRLTRELPPYRSEENLIRILRDNGYFTAAIVSNREASLNLLGFGPFLSTPEYVTFNALTLSFFEKLGVRPTSMGSRMYEDFASIFPFMGFPQRTSGHGFGEDTLARAKKVLSEVKTPFFLFIHVHEPHDPYDSPYAVENSGTSENDLATLRKFPPAVYGYYPHSLQRIADIYRKRYEESIRFLDSELAKFVRLLQADFWSNNLLLIFTADHGESFERGYMNHGEELYENSTHVPLIVKFPFQTQGGKIRGLVQSADIAPTILRVANIPVPTWMHGLPLESDKLPGARDSIAVNFKHPLENTHYPLPTQLAIWWKQYKLIVGCDGLRTELYNLDEDQKEATNLALGNPALVKQLKSQLAARLRGQPGKSKLLCSLGD